MTAFDQPLRVEALCIDMKGFSLHAAVRCGVDDRESLEQLCRYIARPVLGDERVQSKAAGARASRAQAEHPCYLRTAASSIMTA